MNLIPNGNIIDNRFEVQLHIGGNSISQYYRAKRNDGELVQLNLINLASLSTSYFNEEGELILTGILKKIDYPNIQSLIECGYTVFENFKYAFFVFEFLSGESLAEKVSRDEFVSPYTSMYSIIEILDALKYLHSLDPPVVHNNITPQTILIDYKHDTGKTMLTDFMQAREIDENNNSISIKDLSIFYSAPELLNGVFIPQSDLYSIGAVYYRSIFGVPPYYDESILNSPINKQRAMLEQQRSKPLNLFLADEYDLDDHIKGVLMKSLSPSYEDRFQSADEFIKALKREKVLSLSQVKTKASSTPKHERQKGQGFDKVAGMNDLKKRFKEDIIDFINEPDLYKEYGIPMLNGMLLFGPPGCGKTFIAEKFAEEVGHYFIQVKPSDIQSKYVNATQENIGQLFKEANENSPCVIFFDEIDAIAPSRENDLHQMHAAAVNELLVQMTNCGEKNIFVICATNRPEKIDKALLRTGRIDRLIYLPPPDSIAREEIFKIYLKNRPTDLAVDFEILSEMTEYFVASDIKLIIDDASRVAMKSKSRITMEILVDVISNRVPSVSNEVLNYYVSYEKQMRKKVKVDISKPTIGFEIPKNENK